VAWHQWSVVRLAAIAMITVLTGYMTAAILAVKSIDYLLKIAHDDAIELAITKGMEKQKEAYKTRQELLLTKIRSELKRPSSIGKEHLKNIVERISQGENSELSSWQILNTNSSESNNLFWANRSELIVGPYTIKFDNSNQESEYRETEDILKRYKLLGLELRASIRPALIRALTVTLAIMCVLLLLAFTYMALRSKTRIQKIVDGFIRYSHGEDSFRFAVHGHNELGLLSRQFNSMADELSTNRARAVVLEKLASWQTIARKMAHEIKNPLTPIQIMIGQLYRNYSGQDPKYTKLLEKAHHVILEEVTSLRRMVDDFSQFAQLPSPRLDLVNATACAQQTVDLAEDSYRPHQINYEGPTEAIWTRLDDQLIRQALHNLIKNAAEADPNSSSPIVLRLQHTPAHIIFEIEDQGPGISPDIQDRIFEAYVTTKHTGPTPGMGLGLAICQKIVLEHGGRMELKSIPGNTIFRITIPRTTEEIPSEI
jgi:nitrogen fixation/metabolism regulation signal transduction histidine kinase